MRLKTVEVNGRRISAYESNVYIVKGAGSQTVALTFENMDAILKAFETGDHSPIEGIVDQSYGYHPEIRETECGEDSEVVLAFGCWEVGTHEQFKKLYEQLKEINKDPIIQPNGAAYDIGGGYFITVTDGVAHLTDPEGYEHYDNIFNVADLAVLEKEMEHLQAIPPVIYSQKIPVFRKRDGAIAMDIGCKTFNVEEVKKAVAFLTEVHKKQQDKKAEANPVGK